MQSSTFLFKAFSLVERLTWKKMISSTRQIIIGAKT